MSRRPAILAVAAAAAAVAVPAVATGAAAKPQPQDQFNTNGSNQYFTWYGYGNTTNKTGVDSGLAAKGKIAFRFAKKNPAYPGLEIYANVTVLRVDGDHATLGAVITGNYKAGPLEGLGDKGQYIEFSLQDNPTGKDGVSTLSFTGDTADAFTDYDIDFPSAAGSVKLYDRYTAPVAPDPTDTPEPSPTDTPAPTATPSPTATPAPSPTPVVDPTPSSSPLFQ